MNLIKAQHLKLTTKLPKRIGGFNPLETKVIHALFLSFRFSELFYNISQTWELSVLSASENINI